MHGTTNVKYITVFFPAWRRWHICARVFYSYYERKWVSAKFLYCYACSSINSGGTKHTTQFCIPYLILAFAAHTLSRRHVPKPYVLKYCRPRHNIPAGPKTIQLLTLILRRSRTGTVWFYTSTSNKRAPRPKLYTKSLTRDLKRMYSRFTLVRISIKL